MGVAKSPAPEDDTPFGHNSGQLNGLVPADHVAVHLGDGGGSSCSPSESVVDTPQHDANGANDAAHSAQLLEPVPMDRRVTVSCMGVNAWVPAFFAPPSTLDKIKTFMRNFGGRQHVQPAERQVLFSINVACQPGEVLALMGPSGGGKTSLLSVIGGRAPKAMRLEGDVLYNEVHLTKGQKRSVGYVLQDDLLHESLTVYETLYFAAMLRLPKTMSKAQKLQRVKAVIESLGLSKCQNTIIGGFFRRGVSGGERKRVSVGHELLINPSVLLLDEPTSGLDSTTAMHLLQTLRQLAKGGRSICTTIHQPSSRLYQQLDSLLLLSQGRALYYGQAADVVPWFEGLGIRQPMGVNTGDWILDIACGEVTSQQFGKSGEDTRVALIAAADKFLVENPGGFAQNTSIKRYFSTKDSMARANSKLDKKPSAIQRFNTWAANAVAIKDRWGASYLMQISILFTRAVKTRRFETLSAQDFAQFLLVAVMAGMFWWQVGRKDTVVGASDAYGLLFFCALFLAFRIMFSALFTFPNEFKMMLKERASGMYRLSAFYFARTLSDIPMDMFVPSLFVIVVYWMAWLRPTAGAFFSFWMAVLLCQFTAQGFGLVIGAAVMNPKTAQTIAAVIMLTFMLISGYYVRVVPAWIDWLKYLSFLWYAFTLLSKIEFSGRTFYDCNGENPPNPATNPSCVPVNGQELSDALRVSRNVDEWPWEVIVLLGYCIILRFLVYVCLRVKTGNV